MHHLTINIKYFSQNTLPRLYKKLNIHQDLSLSIINLNLSIRLKMGNIGIFINFKIWLMVNLGLRIVMLGLFIRMILWMFV